jgi:AraC family transcriptional regulator
MNMQNPYHQALNEMAETGAVVDPEIIGRGSLGLEVLRAQQLTGADDPPAPFVSVQRGIPINRRTLLGKFDFGAGAFETDFDEHLYFITPPNTECLFDIDYAFDIDLLCWPEDKILKIASDIVGRNVTNFGILHSKATSVPQITQLINGLWSEIRSGNPNGKLLVDTASIQLIAIMVEQAFGGLHACQKSPLLKDWRLRRAVEWIEDHLASDLCIDEIAREAGMSVSGLARGFRAELAMSPYQFVRKRRVERAKGLLHNSAYKIIDIALSVGYENAQHFATLFKSETGVSPSEYRLQI